MISVEMRIIINPCFNMQLLHFDYSYSNYFNNTSEWFSYEKMRNERFAGELFCNKSFAFVK